MQDQNLSTGVGIDPLRFASQKVRHADSGDLDAAQESAALEGDKSEHGGTKMHGKLELRRSSQNRRQVERLAY